MPKKNFRKLFLEGWNRLFEKEEDINKLRTQSLYRAKKGIMNVGTPHDWEDYEEYKKSEEEKINPKYFYEYWFYRLRSDGFSNGRTPS